MTKESFHRAIAEDIYDYILREMTDPEGGFYSATDADSEGVEGKFFVWSKAELEEILGDDAPIAIEYWGITTRGNFEGHNILHVPNDAETVAERLPISFDELQKRLAHIKDKLFAARTQRVAPSLDDKILASWNGLMLASLAEAARVLKREDYLIAAERAGEFILNHMTTDEGRLFRSYRQGRVRFNAYLEDYANVIDAMLELYQTTFDMRWYRAAVRFADFVLEHFQAKDGGFFDTSDDHEKLIVRPRNLQDNATPSGNAMMAKQLLRLAAYTGDSRYDDAARGTLAKLTEAIRQYPQAFGEALNAIDSLISGITEVALVGNPTEPPMRAFLDILSASYRPNTVIALARDDTPGEAEIPLLSYRTRVDGLPTAYVCRQFTCKMPVTEVEALQTQLNESS
ncbi:MAG: thioredoxin domain-containing protein [Chloroflexi bacterium]|nr:MAG: thioredoxin domain-containing protein [Chloroflexota bacterium]